MRKIGKFHSLRAHHDYIDFELYVRVNFGNENEQRDDDLRTIPKHQKKLLEKAT